MLAAQPQAMFLTHFSRVEEVASLGAQLLKLLEDRRFRRLGGLRDQAVNVRIVSATHQSLERMVAEGRFRADLYYRLRIVELQVPPLRERGEDVLLLARHFLDHHAQRYRRGPMFLTDDALQRLRVALIRCHEELTMAISEADGTVDRASFRIRNASARNAPTSPCPRYNWSNTCRNRVRLATKLARSSCNCTNPSTSRLRSELTTVNR